MTPTSQIGPYRIVRELGRGTMGVVYLAEDNSLHREVALKLLHPSVFSGAPDEEQVSMRLRREASVAAKLQHPNIVTIYALLATDHGQPCFVMELVPGRSILDWWQELPKEDFRPLLSVLRQAAGALDYAHQSGIVHRDVKPANLLVRDDGVLKVADFGTAKIRSEKVTQTGVALGTPAYMAPEQVRGEELDGRTDQFALATVTYQLITGRLPFTAPSIDTLFYRILQMEPDRMSAVNPLLPESCSSVVAKALSKNCEHRYPTCLAFVEALTASLEAGAAVDTNAATAAVRTTGHAKVVRGMGGVPMRWVALGVLALIGLAAAALLRPLNPPATVVQAPVVVPQTTEPTPAVAEPRAAVVAPADPPPAVVRPAPQRPTPRQKQAAPAETGEGEYLVVNVKSAAEAGETARTLRRMSYSASPVIAGKKHTVRIGPYRTEQEMAAARQALNRQGIKAQPAKRGFFGKVFGVFRR